MKYSMSEIGKDMLDLQATLGVVYKYKPLSNNPRSRNYANEDLHQIRTKYEEALPNWCKDPECSSQPLISLDGTLLCTRFDRIVIGDYGAFIEIAPEHMLADNLICKKGQEFRMNDPKYKDNVKYDWLTPKDESDCKVYHQKRTVSYADYQPGMYYISPYEVIPVLLELELNYEKTHELFSQEVQSQSQTITM